MAGKQRRNNYWQDDNMHSIKSRQGGIANLVSSQQEGLYTRPYKWYCTSNLGAHFGGPERKLVHRQKVTGKPKGYGDEEKYHTGEPVELARRPVSTVKEHPHHVQDDHEDHDIFGPGMDASDQHTEGDVVHDVKNTTVGAIHGRLVVDGQQHTGYDLDQKTEKSDATEAIQPVNVIRNLMVDKFSRHPPHLESFIEKINQAEFHASPSTYISLPSMDNLYFVKGFGGGPEILMPFSSNLPAWQGHKKSWFLTSHLTMQPRCVQTREYAP